MTGGTPGPPARPRATYRLQLRDEFPFAAARRIVPYLSALGISHVYLSPILAARAGSTHGYDTVDHGRISAALGGREQLEALVDELHRHGMGILLDFVPNHMGIGPETPWWMEVLEWGRASPRAAYFDIDWSSPDPALAGKVLVPVLGDHYGAVLERGELDLRLDTERGTLSVHYFDHRFPVAPREYAPLLSPALERGGGALAPIVDALGELLRPRSGGGWHERRARFDELRAELAAVVAHDPEARAGIEAALDEVNGRPDEPGSMEALHRLLDRQHYRLAFWRVAPFEINYRRFFDINELAGLRMENPELFEESHRLIRELLERDRIQGLRLDHVDGLRDPTGYLERLRDLARRARPGREPFLLVEKILGPEEELRDEWPVEGTTGYEHMGMLTGLFVDPAGERALTRGYRRFTGREAPFQEVALEAKRLILRETFPSEVDALARLFRRVARQGPATRDYTLAGFRTALAGVAAHFRVYRTYVTAAGASAADRREIEHAVEGARRRIRLADPSILAFIADTLTLDLLRRPGFPYRRRDVLDAAMRFQQLTGPVMAKSIEDTAFYRYYRLVPLNEVGSEPERFGVSPDELHETAARRLETHPFSLLASATHDHKRGEDVRARLDVLSEVPREWNRRARRWSRFNHRNVRDTERGPAPLPHDEYLFYQVLVGVWPLEGEGAGTGREPVEGLEELRERLAGYMLKAAREAKARTSWTDPDEAYEAGLEGFVRDVLDPARRTPFLGDVGGFVEAIAATGAVNGLGQTLVKLTSPGVPDFYQGTELWDTSLVDPDNRRPVDYDARREALEAERPVDELLAAWRDGRVKQRLTARVLDFRRRRPALFARGDYRPLEAEGPHRTRVVAFARELDGTRLVTVVPRLAHPLVRGASLPLPRGWRDTSLRLPPDGPSGPLRDLMTDRRIEPDERGRVAVAEVLEGFPVAALVAGDG